MEERAVKPGASEEKLGLGRKRRMPPETAMLRWQGLKEGVLQCSDLG